MAFKVPYMILADGVQEIHRGKINIHGVFDRTYFKDVPARHPGFTVIALLVAPTEDELGKHSISITLEDPAHRQIAQVGGDLTLVPTGGSWRISAARIVVGMQNVPFREFGRHRIVLAVDGEEVADHPLTVERPEPSKPE